MANEEYLKILKQGVKTWNQWRKRNPGIFPDLSDANLRDANLSGANFNKVDFSEADLSGANLSKVNLSEANLIRTDLSHADLSHADLTKANLNDVNLSEATLIRTNLRDANLSNADLSNANLNKANLSSANISYADLSNANITEANLHGAKLLLIDLSHADLIKANLSAANLSHANLHGANLEGSYLLETIFADTTLKDAKGLDKCFHIGRSTIDHRTFQQSGPLPKEFLLGCGLPDNLIEAMLSALKEIKYYSAFISYSHDDKDFALKLEGRLKDEGVLCWLDEHKMLPGDDKYEEVARGIYGWDKFILCCSRSSLASWWVDSEINKVFTKEQQLTKERGGKVKCLIPLDLDGYIFTAECRNAKKDEILSRIAADFTGWNKDEKKFEKELKQVLKALLLDNKGREKPPEPKL